MTDTVPVKWFARSMDQSEIDDKTGNFYFIISCVLSFSFIQTNENCVMTRDSRVLFWEYSCCTIVQIRRDLMKNGNNFMEKDVFCLVTSVREKRNSESPYDESNSDLWISLSDATATEFLRWASKLWNLTSF